MTKLIPLVLCVLCLLTGGCTKNEFEIEFSLPSDTHATYRLVYYATAKGGGRLMETVAAMTSGKCELTCVTRYPTLVYVYQGSAQTPSAIFYAERGDRVEVKGDSSSPVTWEIGGDDINREWSAWRRENAGILAKDTPDPVAVNRAVAAYVRKHTDSPLSTLLLLTSYSRADNEAEYATLWKSLGKGADKDTYVALTARADQPDADLPAAGKFKALPVMLRNDSADTIRLGKAKASILFFWHSDNNGRRAVIDSLKRLARDYPDSTSRLIADFSLSPDSTDWVLTMRYDSLRTTRRAWIFRGEADENLRTLGVRGTPWIIVTDAKGVQKYRGQDITAGARAFRKLMP